MAKGNKSHGLKNLVNHQGLPRQQKTTFGLFDAANAEEKAAADQHNRPFVALKYYDKDWECFSQWDAAELAAFSDFNRKISLISWNEIYKSAGAAGQKTGLGYTKLELSVIDESASNKLKKLATKLSEDISFFEMRLGSEARVHGFRSAETFFLVLLDRNHRVC